MFGWLRPSAMRASSLNMAANWWLRVYELWIFLMMTVFTRPCAIVVRARNTSAIPPVPILRTSVYLPNCSIVRADDFSLQRRDDEVVEPRIGFPVVEAEVFVARALERMRIVHHEERRLQVVDPPRQLSADSLDL